MEIQNCTTTWWSWCFISHRCCSLSFYDWDSETYSLQTLTRSKKETKSGTNCREWTVSVRVRLNFSVENRIIILSQNLWLGATVTEGGFLQAPSYLQLFCVRYKWPLVVSTIKHPHTLFSHKDVRHWFIAYLRFTQVQWAGHPFDRSCLRNLLDIACHKLTPQAPYNDCKRPVIKIGQISRPLL